MYKYIAVAVLSLFLMVSTFLFLPKTRKVKKEKEKPKIVTSQNTENPIVDDDTKTVVSTSFKSDKHKGRKSNEKHYIAFTKEEHDRLIENLRIKTDSLLNVRKERKQRIEMNINEEE